MCLEQSERNGYINEKNFIQYLHKKDEAALDYVVDHYSGLIKSIIRKHLGSIDHFEEECMNDVLLAIWHNIDENTTTLTITPYYVQYPETSGKGPSADEYVPVYESQVTIDLKR